LSSYLLDTTLASLPEAEAELLQEMRQLHADRFDPLSYGLNSDIEIGYPRAHQS